MLDLNFLILDLSIKFRHWLEMKVPFLLRILYFCFKSFEFFPKFSFKNFLFHFRISFNQSLEFSVRLSFAQCLRWTFDHWLSHILIEFKLWIVKHKIKLFDIRYLFDWIPFLIEYSGCWWFWFNHLPNVIHYFIPTYYAWIISLEKFQLSFNWSCDGLS